MILGIMKRSELFFTAVLIPVDFLALVAAGIAAYYSRFHPYFVTVRPVVFDLTIERYTAVVVPIAFVWLIVFAVSGLYSAHRVAIASELTRVALACSTAMAAVFAILFFSRTFFESRFIAVAAWLLAILFVGAARLAIRLLQRSLLSLGIGTHRVVLIGETKSAEALEELFQEKQRFGFEVVGHFADFDETAQKRLMALKKQDAVDEVWLTAPDADPKSRLAILQFCDVEHLVFRYTADLFEAAIGRAIVHTFTGVPVIEVQKTPLDGWGAIYKRAFDIVGSLLLIIVTLPIQVLVAVAIKLDSKGRLLFSRLPDGSKTMRVGAIGKPFHYFKFRTMVEGKHFERYGKLAHLDTRQGPLVKLKDDPRVTRVGKFIRKYSLDEFPEFYLVLLGRMSLVGPRPHLPEEVAKYEPLQRKVLTIKPGITGLAQISGRADLDFDEEVRLDVHYIEHWSPWLDLYILLKTPLAVIFRKGAY
jgi:exopolysaccharide biosynthesis polyprenyl glycosylphosphotransferase